MINDENNSRNIDILGDGDSLTVSKASIKGFEKLVQEVISPFLIEIKHSMYDNQVYVVSCRENTGAPKLCASLKK